MIEPLNSPVEVGLRALILLGTTYPRSFDLGAMVLMDHALLHSGDLGGPESLHPDLPNRSGELGIKRGIYEDGLQVMARAGLVEIQIQPSGIYYSATESGASFIDLLEADYVDRLLERAIWLNAESVRLGLDAIRERLRSVLGRWTEEFIPHVPAPRNGEVVSSE